jgi:hypothetical protein
VPQFHGMLLPVLGERRVYTPTLPCSLQQGCQSLVGVRGRRGVGLFDFGKLCRSALRYRNEPAVWNQRKESRLDAVPSLGPGTTSQGAGRRPERTTRDAAERCLSGVPLPQ